MLNEAGERFDVGVQNHFSDKLRSGYWIAYNRHHRGCQSKLNDVEILFVPKITDHRQLQFWHQVLGICVELLPPGQVSVDVAVFLRRLGSVAAYDLEIEQQRLLICCLLSRLGFYPELNDSEYTLTQRIVRLGEEGADFLQFKIDQLTAKFLDRWVLEFADQHLSPMLAVVLRL